MSRLLALLTLCACAPLPADREDPGAAFAPPLFVFQNGVDFGSFDEEARTLLELGYDGLGSAKPADLAARLEAYDLVGLRVFSVYVRLGDNRIPRCIELMRGRDAIIELTVTSPMGPETARALAELADLAGAAGLRVALYPHFANTVERIAEGLELIELADRPNVGLMFNLCHYLKSEDPAALEATLERAAPHLFAVSTCGADTRGQTWSELIRPLDEGTFDQQRLLRTLRRIGFEGAVGLQCYAVSGDKRENLRRSKAAWDRALRTLNER